MPTSATCAAATAPAADAFLGDCSVHHCVTVLKRFARWGTRGGRFWPAGPLAEYAAPAFAEAEIVPCTRAELSTLLAACGGETTFMGRRLRAMLLIALDTGVRRGGAPPAHLPHA